MVVMNVLGVKLGFTFSAGLFDYLLSYGLGTRPLWLIPVGIVWGLIYYFIFRFAILTWNLKTPGREDVPAATTPAAAELPANTSARGAQYVAALGGKENIKTLGACATRLRLEVYNVQQVDESAIKALGARGVVKTSSGQVQIVIGPEVEFLQDEIKQYLR